MKALSSLVLLILAPGMIHAQALEQEYHQKLYYTCKVWGYARYYHQKLGTDHINWEEALLSTLPEVKNASSVQMFNQSLVSMLKLAGEFEAPYGELPEVPYSLRSNIDLGWFDDPLINQDLRDLLLRVEEHFRPRKHWLLGEAEPGAEISFQRDSSWYRSGDYPPEDIRLLGLFRYWNIINYFFAYKNIMDQDWDSTLLEFIPAFVNAEDAQDYQLAFRQLTTRINDSHALFSSPFYDALKGNCHPPFLARNIEEKLVVTKVLPGTKNLSPGDIILKIDHRKAEDLLDSARRYTAGSNPSVIEMYANQGLLWGDEGEFQVLIDHGDRTAGYTFSRDGACYGPLNATSPTMWKDKVLESGDQVRIVNMGSLTPDKVDELFSFHSRYDAFIFDVRRKPLGSIYTIVDKLFPKPIHHAKLILPDHNYPGTFYWIQAEMGQGTSKPYKGKVMILMDENTRSHSEYTCMALEQYPEALKVGCQTAAADGNVAWVYLPGGIRTAFSNLGVFYPDGSPTQRVGIVPDIEVRPTIQGIREGRDEVLAEALVQLGGTSLQAGNKENFRFYPNPAGEVLCYSCESDHPGTIDLAIRDVSGKLLRMYFSLPASGNISLVEFGPGIYFIEIPRHGVKKLVKYR